MFSYLCTKESSKKRYRSFVVKVLGADIQECRKQFEFIIWQAKIKAVSLVVFLHALTGGGLGVQYDIELVPVFINNTMDCLVYS